MNQSINDPIGKAVYNYHFNQLNKPVIIHSEDFDDDTIDTSYLFRNYRQMPALEKKALNLCKGKVLDVGACAGVHSIHLQKKGFEVVALEKSASCCEVLRDRQLRNVVHANIYEFSGEQFDTILLLMNGTGIAGTLHGLDMLLFKLKALLAPEGQILIDSSDLIYLYEDEDEGGTEIPLDRYYGEITFQTEYEGDISEPFPWLYVDIETLKHSAEKNMLSVEKTFVGQHYDYLARITHKN